MPANVDSMFSVREMPWHREGTILAGYPGTWTEARTLAGLDWDPVTSEVYACTGIDPTAPRSTSPSRAGRPSPGPTPAPCCPSTATATP
jgi:hypothetical protein